MNINNPDWNLIARFLANECSLEEKEHLDEWLGSNPSIRNDIEKLKRICNSPDQFSWVSSLIDAKIDEDWNELESKMKALKEESLQSSKKTKNIFYFNNSRGYSATGQFTRVAALVFIMIVCGFVISYLFYFSDHVSDEPTFREISTKSGQLANLELLDGTKLNLSVESKLRLSNDFNKDSRVLYMEGQALFDVYTNPSKPFIVETKHAVISVLGTNFSVRAYPNENNVQVAVISGSVSMKPIGSGESHPILLYSNNKGVFDIGTGKLSITEIANLDIVKWTEGKIIFNDASISELARELKRWFGIEFHILDDELITSSQRLTGIFDSKSLSHILEVISHTLNVEFIMEDDRFIIEKI